MPADTGLSRWASPLALLLAAAALAARSWRKWPDAIVDYGQQLYVAWRLAEGEVLYRDVAYFHGPLSSYLHAAVMRLGGVSLLSLVFFNLVVTAALVVLLYALLSALASRLAATAAGLVFVTVFAFAQYLRIGNYNYVCPYTYEITHGVVLALAAVFAWTLYLRHGRTRWLVAAGVALGLVFLTKAEVFLATALALAAGVAAGHRRVDRRRLTILGAAALAPPFVAFVVFLAAVPPFVALGSVTAAYAPLVREGTSELLFYRSRMGLDAPLVQLARLAVTALWHLAVLAPAAAAAWLWERTPRIRWALLALAWLPVILAASHLRSTAWLQAARPLPLFMALLIAACLRALVRSRPSVFGEAAAGVFTLAVLALALLFKILLNSRVYHYGFVLAMPATLLLVVAWVDWLPAWLERRGGRGSVFRAVALAVLGVAVTAHLLVTERRLGEKTHLLASGGDAFWTDPRGRAVDALLDYFDRLETKPTLVVVPDGIMLNYLARAPTPVRYLNYVPTEVFAYGEERILGELRARAPDYVAVVEKSTAEFGYRYFGRDYARDLKRWIDAEYDTVATIGARPLTGRGFGVELRKRRRTGEE